MAIVACFLTAGAARGAANLLVQVKADYLPGVDFVGVNVVVCERDRPTVCAQGARPATARERAAYLTGVRAAELEVAERRVYRVSATLVSASGRTVARRLLLLDFRTAAAATLLFARPEIEALKSGSLADDRDGDGTLSAGDVLRYLVVVRGADRFTDTPGLGASLIPGSVTTTHGTVTDGNDAGDVSVAVQGLGEADEEEGAKIGFDVVVTGVVSNQGVAHKDQAVGAASWSSVFQPTDNPATAYVGDPTIHKVGCSLGACEAELAQCEQELQAVRDELTSLTADPDGDGVPAMLDLCPNTPQGIPVNDRGCSRAEFCAQFHVATPAGQLACKHADWRSDEPGVFEPQDCLVLQTTCGST